MSTTENKKEGEMETKATWTTGDGISKANMVKVEAAINEIKATPEWQAKIAREEQNRKDGIAYDKHCATMRKAMRE